MKLITSSLLDDKYKNDKNIVHFPLLKINYLPIVLNNDFANYDDFVFASRHSFRSIVNAGNNKRGTGQPRGGPWVPRDAGRVIVLQR